MVSHALGEEGHGYGHAEEDTHNQLWDKEIEVVCWDWLKVRKLLIKIRLY
ncbi:MAG: hypothetical protein ACUVWK_00045 [Nitrososphaerales archaeon]